MKISLFIVLLLSLSSIHAQDIFVFKNGTTLIYTITSETANSFECSSQTGYSTDIEKRRLSFVQRANGQQIVFDNVTHGTLKLVDLQYPHQDKCYQSKYAMAPDNETPGTKAVVTAEQAEFYGNMCLTRTVHAQLIKGDAITLQQAFIGCALVVFKSGPGLVMWGWVKWTDIQAVGR